MAVAGVFLGYNQLLKLYNIKVFGFSYARKKIQKSFLQPIFLHSCIFTTRRNDENQRVRLPRPAQSAASVVVGRPAQNGIDKRGRVGNTAASRLRAPTGAAASLSRSADANAQSKCQGGS
jgi:hypothetical protein